MIVRMVFTALILVAGVSTTRAQEVTKVGTDAAPFLTIPVGARGAAVGGALVAMADDASAAYWNPGGLARVERNALMVDHSPWLPGLSFNFFSLALPVGVCIPQPRVTS